MEVGDCRCLVTVGVGNVLCGTEGDAGQRRRSLAELIVAWFAVCRKHPFLKLGVHDGANPRTTNSNPALADAVATHCCGPGIGLGDRGAAAQLALGLLVFALLVAALEHINRGAATFAPKGRREPFARFQLAPRQAVAAQLVCLLPVLLGVILPTITLFVMGMRSEQDIFSPRYLRFIENSLMLAGVAAVVTVCAAVFLGTFHRMLPQRVSLVSLFVGRLGYAVPGGVIAVGLLVPFARFDNWLDARMEAWFDISTGLLITGSIWLMIAAYMIRFLAAAIGAYDSGLATVTQNVDAASRVLGRTAWGTVRDVHLAVLRPSILTALLIVFVDTVKELPATLILRPFNYDTLAVHAFRLASDERLDGAAVPSLMIAGIGLLPVILLCAQIGTSRRARTE